MNKPGKEVHQWTKDYDMFEHSKANRTISQHRKLLALMKKNGFSPADPIHCVRSTEPGKLIVKRGHHRLECAKKLGIELCYVVFEDTTTIAEYEGSHRKWSAKDYIESRARAGDFDYQLALDHSEASGIRVSQVIQMLMNGEANPSITQKIKNGQFEIRFKEHFHKVESIILYLREMNIPYAKESALVSALSLVCHLEDFDSYTFIQKLKKSMHLLYHAGNKDNFLIMIETIWNHGTKHKIPLKLDAINAEIERKKLNKQVEI